MAKIFSQLEKAQLENTTSDTGSLPKGMVTYRTDLNVAKVSNGTSMVGIIDETSTQTMSAKTLTSPVVGSAATFAQITTPGNPSSGFNKVYPKADNLWYTLTSSGTEALLGASALAISTKTANYTLTTSDNVVLGDATSGTITLTLPTAVGNTQVYTLKRVDSTAANRVIIATTSSQTIDGVTSKRLLTQFQSIQVYSDGSNWRVLSSSWPNPIAARLSGSTTTLVNNAYTKVVFTTVNKDNTGSVASSEFTVPVGGAGEYTINAFNFQGAGQIPASSARRASLGVIYVNGAQAHFGPAKDSFQSTVTAYADTIIGITRNFAEGDVIYYAVYQNLGADAALDGCELSIVRTGD